MSLRPAEVPLPTGKRAPGADWKNSTQKISQAQKQKQNDDSAAERAQEQTPRYWDEPCWRPWPAPLGASPDTTAFNWDESDKAWAEIYRLQNRAIEVIQRILPRVHDRLEAVRPSSLVPLVQPEPLATPLSKSELTRPKSVEG